MTIIKKWQILGEKGKFRQKWQVCQKFIKALAKYSNKKTKERWRSYENYKYGKNLLVWQKFTQDDKRGMSLIVGFTKMTYFAKLRIWQRIH